jgi:hypothetical protein
MIYKLYYSKTQYLLSQPETGMGYQLIEAKQHNKLVSERFVVYNAELIIDFDVNFKSYRSQIISEGYNSIFNKAGYIDIEDLKILKSNEVKEYRTITESKRQSKLRQSGGNSAVNNPKQPATGDDYFARLSAFENDRRIDFENKCLRSGSYTTTLRDYAACVKLDDDPIDRYALPNEDKIKWAFYIRPKKGELYQEGIVQPAFGHDGGGIEDYFVDGTLHDTYIGKLEYGKFE